MKSVKVFVISTKVIRDEREGLRDKHEGLRDECVKVLMVIGARMSR
jgi:hypothetical protein